MGIATSSDKNLYAGHIQDIMTLILSFGNRFCTAEEYNDITGKIGLCVAVGVDWVFGLESELIGFFKNDSKIEKKM